MGWNSAAGQYISAWEQALLDAWAADVFGYDAAQIGQTERLHGLQNNRCVQRWAVEEGERVHAVAHTGEIRAVDVGDFTVLPFDSNSMDFVILPHTLDNHPDPHAVLREAYRVLRPEGKMLILGFNPLSLWGGAAMCARWRKRDWWGHQHQALHVARLKDWLQLLSCDIVQGKYGCYAPHVGSQKWLERWGWLEKAGDRWWGMAGAVYAIMAVKRVYSPTLVGRIRHAPSKIKWVAQPALNTANQHKRKR